MKILQIPPYYLPEQISSSHLTDDLEETYVSNGFEVTVYVPLPSRNISKKVRKEYKKRKYEEKYDGKLKIHRFPMFREGKNPVLRAFRYILCNIIQYWKGIHAKDIDIIISGSTPPTQGLLCSFVKKKLGVPFIYNLQDVFPDSLVHAGLAKKNSILWKIGRKIEDYTYKNADKVIVISRDIKENIMEKGVPESKIVVIHNWIDTQKVKPVQKSDNLLMKEFGPKGDCFYVVYAGNLGKAQNVEGIIDAAANLRKENDIRFLIFGNGIEEEKLKKKINDLSLGNIEIYPLQPESRVAEVYSLGDVCIVSCRKGYGSNAFPSKAISIMATATPILASFDRESELCKILEEKGAGLCSEPENAEDLVDIIKHLKNHRKEAEHMGANGRRIAEEQFSKEVCTMKYVEAIKDLIKIDPN